MDIPQPGASETFTRSQLTNPIRRLIRKKEQYLEKKCRKIWCATNPKNICFMFGRFTTPGVRDKIDPTIVTLAHYENGLWIPSDFKGSVT